MRMNKISLYIMKLKVIKSGYGLTTVKRVGTKTPKNIDELKDIKGKAELEKLVLRESPQKYVRFV